MSLLKKATNESAYLKCAFLGFAGSGKTHTGTKVAIGLHQMIKSKKPIGFIDTETGSDFVLPMFHEAGIALMAAKSRAFVDLIQVVKEAEKTCEILIIDSITHFYDELIKSYQEKRKIKRLRVQDWGPIKEEWRQFTDLYINSKLHIIMNGRAGWVYDFAEDDDGITEIRKTGTKMKAETDMGYEPSLLIEMEKVKQNTGKAGQTWANRGWVLKDRFNKINGKFFDNPKFEDFLPHINLLNIGGKHVGVIKDNTSKTLFDGPSSRVHWLKRRDIALENIQVEMLKRWPGMTASDKKAKVQCLESVFGTASWTAIQDKSPEELERCLMTISKIAIQEDKDGKNEHKQK